MQMRVANALEVFLQTSSREPRSFEQVLKTLTDGMLREHEQNSTEWLENEYG